MKIKENESIPNSEVFILENGEPVKKNIENFLKNKKSVIFGLPGAYTSVCSAKHLPGYVKNSEKYKEKGIDQIIFVSVNDPFVLNEWIKTKKADEISYLADPFCNFGEKTGLTLDLTVIGLGKRLSRFAMLVDNGKVIKLFDEDGGGLDKSSAKSVIEAL